MVAQRQADDLLQQRLVFQAKDGQLAAGVLDVVLQQQNALLLPAAARLQLVQIQPLQQSLMDGSSRSERIPRRWASSSCRLMTGAASASNVSV